MTDKLLISASLSALAIPCLMAFNPSAPARISLSDGFRGHEAACAYKVGTMAAKGPHRSMGMTDADQLNPADFGELTLMFEEDFSLLTTGSEAEPDMNTVLNYQWGDAGFEYVWNNMMPKYVHGDLKWGVDGAYPAGGMLYFAFSRENPEAHIVTPMTDYSANDGTFVVEFRAKAAPGTEVLAFSIDVADTRNWGPTWDYFDESVTFDGISEEWTTYRAIFQNGGPTSLCNIYAAGMEGGIYLDDVKVYTLAPYVKTPVLKLHKEFTQTSFRANWEAVEGADSYLIDIWTKDDAGNRVPVITDRKVEGTSFEMTDADETLIYFYDVRAVKGDKVSLRPLAYEVFDIVAPEMDDATISADGRNFTSRVKPVASARGYNFYAMAERTADADGPFVITDEKFTGWKHPGIEEPEPPYTLENPYDMVSPLWYPQDINQQGWRGENFMTYKDFLCLDPYFYTMSGEQAGWISPEFDLSKDDGKISIDLKLAGKLCPLYDENGNPAGNVIAECVVALFNWDDEIDDYRQVESVTCKDVKTRWSDFHVDLTKGSERSVIGFFAINSYDNLYIDDILIQQNYKAGESFLDPFAYRTWLLADQIVDQGGDFEKFTFSIPERVWGLDVFNKAQAARIHFDERGSYNGEAISGFSPTVRMGSYNTVSLATADNAGTATICDGVLSVINPDAEPVFVYTADGKAVTLGNATEISYTVESGVCLVRIGEKTIRLMN